MSTEKMQAEAKSLVMPVRYEESWQRLDRYDPATQESLGYLRVTDRDLIQYVRHTVMLGPLHFQFDAKDGAAFLPAGEGLVTVRGSESLRYDSDTAENGYLTEFIALHEDLVVAGAWALVERVNDAMIDDIPPKDASPEDFFRRIDQVFLALCRAFPAVGERL